jgi:hypothetical protein
MNTDSQRCLRESQPFILGQVRVGLFRRQHIKERRAPQPQCVRRPRLLLRRACPSLCSAAAHPAAALSSAAMHSVLEWLAPHLSRYLLGGRGFCVSLAPQSLFVWQPRAPVAIVRQPRVSRLACSSVTICLAATRYSVAIYLAAARSSVAIC